ncbi:hypothetical protein [Halorhodospira halophila]|uniref:Uncharacterized protein n=1 Tax=Halorhodospira halophila (strain DSM 244 / SL1) TaxID=349124 RepID=A1WWJ2_HALHL|nr:hypothetical protein [Halorhodospira halophila]ABM62054.1 hypothetical protein Hhal_1280 [Halorhodospira halophila SL1]MBK1730176.1 hypothetical protein [Halorhodospira halophila]
MLVYPPNAETGVYLLLGQLRPYLPFELAIDSFEICPHSMGYAHSKHLDALGYWLRDDEWERISIEFKLHSSGMLRDLTAHPDLTVDLLVCWQDDVPGELTQSVAYVLALDEVLANAPEEERTGVIRNPKASAPREHAAATTEAIIARFAEHNRPKVERLCQGWPQYRPGASELIFTRGTRTLFRAVCYSTEHLYVTEYVAREQRKHLVDRFGGDWYQGGAIKVPFDRLDAPGVDHLLSVLGP